jgi:hypothetical protein
MKKALETAPFSLGARLQFVAARSGLEALWKTGGAGVARDRDPGRTPTLLPRDLVYVDCPHCAPRGAPGWRACMTYEDYGETPVALYCPTVRRELAIDVERALPA